MVYETLDPIDDVKQFIEEMADALQPALKADRQRKVTFFEHENTQLVFVMILNGLTAPYHRTGKAQVLANEQREQPTSELGHSLPLDYVFGVPVWGFQNRHITSVRDLYPEASYDGAVNPVQLISGVLVCKPNMDNHEVYDYLVVDPNGREKPILMHDFLAGLEEEYL